MGVGTGEGLCFDRGFLGNGARLLQCLHHAYLEVLGDPSRNNIFLKEKWLIQMLATDKWALEFHRLFVAFLDKKGK